MAIRQLDGVDVRGKRVLVRVDYNVPCSNGRVTDNSRIIESLDTLRYLLNGGAEKIIILSHFGRPLGNVVEEMRLGPVVQALSELIGEEVDYIPKPIDEVTTEDIDGQFNKLICLENVRFDRREEEGSEQLAKKIALLGDLFVLDGFSVAHRPHATVTKLAELLPSYAGFGFMHEKGQIDDFIRNIRRPFWGVFGGIKLSDKLPVIKSLQQMDGILVGSSIAMAVLDRFGFGVGGSMIAKDSQTAVDDLVDMISRGQLKVVFPSDLIVGQVAEEKISKVVEIDINQVIKNELQPFAICEENEAVLDIGEKSVAGFINILQSANSVFWNGPLGMAEKKVFAGGTKNIGEFLAGSGKQVMVGGGDTLGVLKDMNLTHNFEYISTSGGAMMEYIANHTLPGIDVLADGREV